MAKFAEIVAAAPEPITVLELGACDGRDTRAMAEAMRQSGKDFYLFAFEPDERRHDRFWQQVAEFPHHVTLSRAAVGNHIGPARFWLSNGGEYIGSSSLHMPVRAASENVGIRFEETVVHCTTLDRFATTTGINRVEFIWADVQGAEADMIEGGRETLKRTRWLYTEADGNGQYEGDVNEEQICALLPGWENRGRLDGNLLLFNGKA